MLWTGLRPRPTWSLRTCMPLSGRPFGFTLANRFPRGTHTTPPLPDKPPIIQERIPSFQEEIARTTQLKSFSENISRPAIKYQVLFFVFGSYIAFALAAKKTNNDTDYWSERLRGMSHLWSDRLPTNDEMRRTQYFELGKKLQGKLAKLKEVTAEMPSILRDLIVFSYVDAAQRYLDTTDARRVCWKICAINGFIWLAWKLPRLRNFMAVNFMHHPRSGLSYTLLTSMFSHKGIFHLVFNCMALNSFGSVAAHFMAREQMSSSPHLRESSPKWHFLAFFVSAGLFSGLVSHIASSTIRYPRLISQISSGVAPGVGTIAAKTATSRPLDILPSLGASGAIYAAVTVTTLAFPETQISLIFPPTYPIPITYGVGGLLALDLIGAFRGWRYLDHFAHLGGAGFGVLYYAYGPQFWNSMRVFHQSPHSDKS